MSIELLLCVIRSLFHRRKSGRTEQDQIDLQCNVSETLSPNLRSGTLCKRPPAQSNTGTKTEDARVRDNLNHRFRRAQEAAVAAELGPEGAAA